LKPLGDLDFDVLVSKQMDFKFFNEFDSLFLAGIGYHDGKVSQPTGALVLGDRHEKDF
jgi:hypothetical protein